MNYHVPIYSICERPDEKKSDVVNALFHWVPHFDNQRVVTVYENHVHAFKRTFPIKGNLAAEGRNGTVYLGDGNYGSVPKTNCELNRDLGIFASSSH